MLYGEFRVIYIYMRLIEPRCIIVSVYDRLIDRSID